MPHHAKAVLQSGGSWKGRGDLASDAFRAGAHGGFQPPTTPRQFYSRVEAGRDAVIWRLMRSVPVLMADSNHLTTA
ncbi:hypothetical protein N7474_005497 [Penicillium riverlandense]|uniref:uncharacterized protein n=1 Tax=Penicillium riverlandense TaxID=1903569 RepID=UPI002547CC29|nr:uncharacterized protein N7474_005497 [Penicillium riverlandense]KAJ5819906.1 hypothetical protein N7474_005497 [Penicillium riverlandense]